MDNIKKLRAELAAKRQELQKLHETAEAEDRNLTEDEQAQWDTLKAEAEGLQQRADRSEEMARQAAQDARPVQPIVTDVHDNAEDEPWGENPNQAFAAFMRSVHQACPQVSDQIDPRLRRLAAPSGTNEGVPSEGGFLLEPATATYIDRIAFESAQLAARCFPIEVGEGRNSATIKCIDETSRVTGSRFGGIQVYWTEEAGEILSSKPKWRSEDVKLKKVAGLWYVTDEELEDVSWLASVGPQAFGEEIAWIIDEAIFKGNGVGKPLGFQSSGAVVTVDKVAGQPAATFEYQNAADMWARVPARSVSRLAWIVNQDVMPQLQIMRMPGGLGGMAPVFLPPTGAAEAPYGMVFGRPIIPTEHNPTLGTAGDVVLADLGWYALVRKAGVKAASSIHVRFVYEETAFRFSTRVNGIPMLSSPITPASGSGNTISPFVQLQTRS